MTGIAHDVQPSIKDMPSGHERISLNAADAAMLHVDRSLRHLHLPGFHTQMAIALSGRVDAERLRDAIAALSRIHPIVRGRIRSADGKNPYWELAGHACELHEVHIEEQGMDEGLSYAGLQLSRAGDIEDAPPLTFFLLHLRDRDVFIAQYNHVLLDNSVALSLLNELQELTSGQGNRDERGMSSQLLRSYLKRLPQCQRRDSGRQMISAWRESWSGGVLTLALRNAAHVQPVRFHVLRRKIDADRTSALREFACRACGLPSLSMVLLAAAFRAIHKLAPQRDVTKLNAAIGVDLGLRRGGAPLFQNLVSLIPMGVSSRDLDDPVGLTQLLSFQLKRHLENGIDVRLLHWTRILRKRPRPVQWVVGQGLRSGFSLWYGFFGSQNLRRSEFFGATIDDLFYVGPTWSPMGMTLLINPFRGALSLQVTYLEECVSHDLIGRFLDEIVATDWMI